MAQKCGRSLLAGLFQLRSLALIGSASLSEGEVWRVRAIFFAIICSIVYKILVYCLSANPLALCIDDSADYAYIAIDCQQVQRFNLDSFEVVQTINTGEEPDVMVILPEGFSKHWENN